MEAILTNRKKAYKDEAASIMSIMETIGFGKTALHKTTNLSRSTIDRFFGFETVDYDTYIKIKNAVSAKAIKTQIELSKQLKTA